MTFLPMMRGVSPAVAMRASGDGDTLRAAPASGPDKKPTNRRQMQVDRRFV
jgi:hypothetical protein